MSANNKISMEEYHKLIASHHATRLDLLIPFIERIAKQGYDSWNIQREAEALLAQYDVLAAEHERKEEQL